MMPPPAQRFTVYFEAGGAVLTTASQVAMNEALAAALARSGGEIVVTGHTDTVGTQARNDNLSLTRALEIRQLFVARDFPPGRIEAVGRGERELAVRTADEVDEPRNRRVTIDVR
jgi:outer membrane protein OmpA-like peptidoglycan-associated protein